MVDSSAAAWGTEPHQQVIARWLSDEMRRRQCSSLETLPERQLNWVAHCARSGPADCREDLIASLDMQLNVLMLLFGGTAGFFAMLPPNTSIGVFIGAISMLVPSIGALVVLLLAGHIRMRSVGQFLPFLLGQEGRGVGNGGSFYIIVGSAAFALSAVTTVAQMQTERWLWQLVALCWFGGAVVALGKLRGLNSTLHRENLVYLSSAPGLGVGEQKLRTN